MSTISPKRRTEKTVYILGAGFAMSAGAPRQADIMPAIIDLDETIEGVADRKPAFKKFLKVNLNVSETAMRTVALEDIYTPMDRCIADGTSLRGMSPTDLIGMRGKVDFLVSSAIKWKIASDPKANRDYIPAFARHLVKIAAHRAELAKGATSAAAVKEYDPFSVICLNWDLLLDNALHEALAANDGWPASDYAPFGVVDYCCYVSSLEKNEPRIRSGLWSLGAGGYNIKLLKIHGSMNWLQCPNCQRLFTAFGDKLNVSNEINRRVCRHCKDYDYKVPLRGTLVMPTFLKDLSNFQIKLVWQNTGVEIMEADKLVFVGYSLPHADFEFRQLLSRMVHRNAKVEVILRKSSKDFKEVSDRYRQFFSGNDVNIPPDILGVVEYVEKLVAPP